MKLYIVTADTYDCDYGSEISLFGVYTDEDKAREKVAILELRYDAHIDEVDADTDCEICLGGYTE